MDDTDNPYASPGYAVAESEAPEASELVLRGRRIYFALLAFELLVLACGVAVYGVVYPAIQTPVNLLRLALWHGIWRGWKSAIVLCWVLTAGHVLSECLTSFIVPITVLRVVAFAFSIVILVLFIFSKSLREFFQYQRSKTSLRF